MRRTLTIFILTAICTVSAMAQFRYGPTLGADVSTLRFKQPDLFPVSKSVGYSAGVQAEMMFPGIGFGIDFGLMYQQRGATLNLSGTQLYNPPYTIERSYLHYAVIPIHLRFKYTNLGGLEDWVAPFAYAGPSFGLLLAHNKLGCLEYPAGELGIDFGLGVEVRKRWQISASYTMGMTYAVKAAILTDQSARNGVWSLSVGYLF